MNAIYEFIMTNIYLYLCIIIVLIIVATILSIIVSNQKNRNKIKKDFVEAEKIENELEKIEENPNNELENILKKMQEDVNVKPEDVVKKFEEEQEEKAIISYKELVDNVKSGKIEVVDDEQGDTNFVEKLNIDDNVEPVLVESKNDSSVTPDMVKEAIENISISSIKEEPKKFKNSEIISPIYGVIKEELNYNNKDVDLDIMNTKEYDELTEEIRKQEEFLEALKAFRNNL